MRLVLHGQLLFFLSYGIVSGMAFSHILHTRVQEAEMRATAAIICHLSIQELSELTL